MAAVATVVAACISTTPVERHPPSELNHQYIGIVVLVQLLISIVSWLSLILSLNRWRSFRNVSAPEAVGFGLYVFVATVRVVGALATRTSDPVVQFFMSTTSSVLTWLIFVLLYNNALAPPTHQQWMALPFTLILNTLWEVQSYAIVNLL